MRRAIVCLALAGTLACDGKKSPTQPAEPPAQPAPATAAAVFVTPMTLTLPSGGGSSTLDIYTSISDSGRGAATFVPVHLVASDGFVTPSDVTTDGTGHARAQWSGDRTATITATAQEVSKTTTITVGPAPAPAPPTPTPSPNPNPSPSPTPAPTPTPAPPPAPGPPRPNDPPFATNLVLTISASPASPLADQSVTLTAALSSTDGSAVPAIASYIWDTNGDRQPDHLDEASPVVKYAAGNYTITLEVTTSEPRRVIGTLPLTVDAIPSVAVTLAATPASAGLGDTITLTATATPSGNTGALSYAWDFDGNGSTDQTTAVNTTTTTYPTIGTKTPKVTVTGAISGSGSATSSVLISAPALAVALSVSGTQTAGSTITITATVTAATGTPPSSMTFAWDYGNGQEQTTGGPSHSVNHVYSAPGTYKVRVTVTSPDGRTATSTRDIIIS